jgi:hypothetical protein
MNFTLTPPRKWRVWGLPCPIRLLGFILLATFAFQAKAQQPQNVSLEKGPLEQGIAVIRNTYKVIIA